MTTALATAIQRKNWDFVALCLLLGVAEVAATLPPETLDQLLSLLDLDLLRLPVPTVPLPQAGEGARRAYPEQSRRGG